MGLTVGLAVLLAATRSTGVSGTVAQPAADAALLGPVTGNAPQDIGSILSPIVARAKIPGAAAMVLRGGRIIAEGVAGVRRIGTTVPVTIDDEFEICSCAKAMTAALTARLVAQGRLGWGTTLADVFGDVVPRMDPAWKNVTIRQALDHRAGLKDHLLLFAGTMLSARGDEVEQRRTYVAKILSRPPDFPPGSRFVYNSTDYLIVGAALEKITGRRFEDLMREEIFRPLGLASAGFGPPGTAGHLDQPWGHGVRRLFNVALWGRGVTPFDPGSAQADYPMIGAPAGLVHVSLGDWAKFVTVYLRGHPANPHHVGAFLPAEVFERFRKPAADENYIGGWFIGTRPWARGARPGDTGRVLFHQGDNGRWNTAVWVAPEVDFAVLVACNRAHMWKGVDEIAGALVGKFAALSAGGATGN